MTRARLSKATMCPKESLSVYSINACRCNFGSFERFLMKQKAVFFIAVADIVWSGG